MVMVSAVLNGCKTWSLALMEGRCVRTVQRRILGCKSESNGARENCVARNLIIFHHQILLKELSNLGDRWAKHEAYMGEDETGFLPIKLKEGDHPRDLGVSRRIIVKMVLEK
jgi:hypothetical protein